MQELYEKTKEFLQENYVGELNDETLDILTVSIMALYGKFSDVSIKRLPSILNKLEFHFGDESISKMVSKRYPEYPIEELAEDANSLVTRALELGEDNKFNEEWSMYVSTYDIENRLVNIVGKSVHELIHLLRFNGIILFMLSLFLLTHISFINLYDINASSIMPPPYDEIPPSEPNMDSL